MNGPEHYREAERLLEFVTYGGPGAADVLATAQVHATLALAAAAATASYPPDSRIVVEWIGLLKPPAPVDRDGWPAERQP